MQGYGPGSGQPKCLRSGMADVGGNTRGMKGAERGLDNLGKSLRCTRGG